MSETKPTTSPQRPATRVLRRRYLIDPARQLRTVALTASVVAILVILVNLGFAALRSSQFSFLSAVAPQLGPVIDRQEATWSVVMLVCSVVLVVAVVAKTIVDTHRTAGAVFAVKQRFERVRLGDLHVTLKLRRNDHLADLEGPFNDMVASIRVRASDQADRIDDLADRLQRTDADHDNVAGELRELAATLRDAGT